MVPVNPRPQKYAPYNTEMKHVLPSLSRAVAITGLLTLNWVAPAFAQTTAATATPAQLRPADAAKPAPAGTDQKIQRIRTEDSGSRIDELRVGGETQSITVQPKAGSGIPSYEVKPPESAKGNSPSASSGDTNGSRVWNVLKF